MLPSAICLPPSAFSLLPKVGFDVLAAVFCLTTDWDDANTNERLFQTYVQVSDAVADQQDLLTWACSTCQRISANSHAITECCLQPVELGALPYYADCYNAVIVSMLLYNMNHVCCAARLFVQLVDLFQFYMMFPIDDHTGDPVSDEDVTAAHYEKVQQVT